MAFPKFNKAYVFLPSEAKALLSYLAIRRTWLAELVMRQGWSWI